MRDLDLVKILVSSKKSAKSPGVSGFIFLLASSENAEKKPHPTGDFRKQPPLGTYSFTASAEEPKTKPKSALRRRLVDFLLFNSINLLENVPADAINRVQVFLRKAHGAGFFLYFSDEASPKPPGCYAIFSKSATTRY